MKAKINMINVEDGDAIFIGLEKNGEKALIVIDGGYPRFYEDRVKTRLAELLPLYDNKIRLMVCTHYDNDHLVGARRILNDYHNNIQEIWIHKIEDTLDEEIFKMEESLHLLKESNSKKDLNPFMADFDSSKSAYIIENYRELLSFMKEIRDFGMEEKCVQAVRGTKLEGFNEFEVIGPTPAYYNSLLHELKKEKYLADIKYNLIEKDLNSDSAPINEAKDLMKRMDPCSFLETSSRSNRVTATNMVSIVTLLNANGKKFLFTGDTGIESFESNNLLDNKVENLDWLQLPHHGSKNNTSKNMLDHFKPDHVFVSGNGGPNRPHRNIIECLNRQNSNINLQTTNSHVTTWYLSINEKLEVQRTFL
ncbi:ComEC/Rec2 family competence protein [Algoriphagus sp.]|uniref:ComEC/Rec2 family competence protein n=1 Tax=Algoriphagus sp. TaxID=1872435 RepID=UPI003F701923